MSVKNQFKTVILLGALTGILLWVGNLVGGPQGLTVALIFSIIMNFGAYWFSDKLVLAIYRAKEVKEPDAPTLYKVVREVIQLTNIPMPKVYMIPSDASNAFATGATYKKAAVACTRGILNLMNEDELKGVIAHEVSHIKNKDTLIQTVAATIAGVISYIAFMARWGAIFGGFGRDGDDGGGMIELLVLAIITPILAMIIQLAISRSREYIADASAAKILHNPHGLSSALEKLHADVKKHPLRLGNQSTAHLFISNPFKSSGFLNMLSTHPPLEKRVNKLKDMTF